MAQTSRARFLWQAWVARRAFVSRATSSHVLADSKPLQVSPGCAPLGPCRVTPRDLASAERLRFSIRQHAARFSTITYEGVLPCPSVPGKDIPAILEAGGSYLDVRSPKSFSEGHVPGAVNVPLLKRGPEGPVVIDEFAAHVEERFPRDTKLAVGCMHGKRSRLASKMLVDAGFTDITNVEDGLQGWVDAGHPVEK